MIRGRVLLEDDGRTCRIELEPTSATDAGRLMALALALEHDAVKMAVHYTTDTAARVLELDASDARAALGHRVIQQALRLELTFQLDGACPVLLGDGRALPSGLQLGAGA